MEELIIYLCKTHNYAYIYLKVLLSGERISYVQMEDIELINVDPIYDPTRSPNWVK